MFDNLMTFVQENQNSGTSFSELVVYVLSVAGMWKMFEKAGQPGWPAIIPFYNAYKLCEICMGNPWYWLRQLVIVIPVVGWIGYLYFSYQMYKAVAHSYGKSDGWAWGLLFLTPIFYCILGFGDAEYYGIDGRADRRTSQAREAKTVNFDVVKNEPDAPKAKDVKVEEVKKEDTVDFTFDQPEE